MKKQMILTVICIVLALVVGILGVVCIGMDRKIQKDVALLYIDPANSLLDVISADAAFDSYRESGVLYLDTEKMTRTDCSLLVEQMAFYAERKGLTLVSCSREQAVQNGYLQQDGENYTPKDCVWMTMSDRRIDENTIQTSMSVYAGSRGAYFADITLTKREGQWLITDLGGGMA